MAHVSQERKAIVAKLLKEVIPAGWKYSLSVRHHSALVLTISAAPVDLVKLAVATGKYSSLDRHVQLNQHYLHEHFKGTEVHEVMVKIQNAMFSKEAGYFDESDITTDYFHCAYYVDVNLGKWNKGFVHVV